MDLEDKKVVRSAPRQDGDAWGFHELISDQLNGLDEVYMMQNPNIWDLAHPGFGQKEVV